jgi:hypothetical protein
MPIITYRIDESDQMQWASIDSIEDCRAEALGLLSTLSSHSLNKNIAVSVDNKRLQYKKEELIKANKEFSKNYYGFYRFRPFFNEKSIEYWAIDSLEKILKRRDQCKKLQDYKIPKAYIDLFGEYGKVKIDDKVYGGFKLIKEPDGNDKIKMSDWGNAELRYIDFQGVGIRGVLLVDEYKNNVSIRIKIEQKSESDAPVGKYSKIQCEWCDAEICSNGAAQFSHLKKHLALLVKEEIITDKDSKKVRSTKLTPKMRKIFVEAHE